jgi:hypothetical protein
MQQILGFVPFTRISKDRYLVTTIYLITTSFFSLPNKQAVHSITVIILSQKTNKVKHGFRTATPTTNSSLCFVSTAQEEVRSKEPVFILHKGTTTSIALWLQLQLTNLDQAGIQCIPSTPAPKRSRRKPTKELLARLERCEELLKRCTCVQKSLLYSSYQDRNMASPTYTSTEGSNGSASPEREKLEVWRTWCWFYILALVKFFLLACVINWRMGWTGIRASTNELDRTRDNGCLIGIVGKY